MTRSIHDSRPSESLSGATRAVHAGRGDLRRLGVHAPPLDLSSTYPLATLEAAGASLEQMAEGGEPSAGEAVYGRLFNPTVDRFEKALSELEGASSSVAFGSGMAALTAVLLALRSGQLGEAKDHVVAVRPLYGGSDHLLSSGLLGLDVTWATAGGVADAIGPRTGLVIVESPANPTLELHDIAAISAAASRAGVPVLVDSTFATPVLQRPLELGAELVLHSATKFLGGHGDVIAGVVAVRSEAWGRALRRLRVATGALLHPLAAYLLHRGLATLPLRVEAAQRTAGELARRLETSPFIRRVFYPGLTGDPLLGAQMAGPGCLLSFEVRGGFEAASEVLRRVRLMTPAVSLGSVDTLIQHPAGLTHRVVPEPVRSEAGVSPAMLRLAVGLEDAEDLWRDLHTALTQAHGVETSRVARRCRRRHQELKNILA